MDDLITKHQLYHHMSNQYMTAITVKPVLKDHPTENKFCGLSRQVVSCDRFSCTEMLILLPKMCTFRTGGLLRQWSLKIGFIVSVDT